jgi:hypothetical protein
MLTCILAGMLGGAIVVAACFIIGAILIGRA